MSTQTIRRIHTVYALILAVLILGVGVGFALSCLDIYNSGDSPFTRESIAAHASRMAIPTYITMAGVVGGGLLAWFLPRRDLFPTLTDTPSEEAVKAYRLGVYKPRRDALAALKKHAAKLDLAACEASVRQKILRERKFRRGMTVTVAVLSGVTLLPALFWCVNPAHFSVDNLNADIRAAASLLLPCAAVSLGLWVAAVLLRDASVSRETEATKKAALAAFGKKFGGRVVVGGKAPAKDSAGTATPTAKPDKGKKKITADPRFLWGVRGGLFVLGVVFIVLGVANGGMADVLGKAIRICTECIGLG